MFLHLEVKCLVFVGELMRSLELQNGEFVKGLLELVTVYDLKHFVVGIDC